MKHLAKIKHIIYAKTAPIGHLRQKQSIRFRVAKRLLNRCFFILFTVVCQIFIISIFRKLSKNSPVRRALFT